MVVNALREWRLRGPKSEAGLVFPNAEGGVESLPNITRRGLVPIERAAGLAGRGQKPRYGMHAFRHAAASLLIAEGWSPKRIQTVMGHSTIGVTFDVYGHLFPSPDNDEKALERLQARVVG